MTGFDSVEEMLYVAADRLGDLREQVVFVGGAVRDLLVTDTGAASARPTDDVDVVFEVSTYYHYMSVDRRLRERGFANDPRPDAPTCRFVHGALVLDMMPTNESILGFTNEWYLHAVATATLHVLRISGRPPLTIRLITASCFVATKLAAFANRGKGDLQHHDIEDIVAIVDGRSELLAEIEGEHAALRDYVGRQLQELLRLGLEDQLRWHLAGDAAGDARLPRLRERIRRLAAPRGPDE